jgi:hypothetical protein
MFHFIKCHFVKQKQNKEKPLCSTTLCLATFKYNLVKLFCIFLLDITFTAYGCLPQFFGKLKRTILKGKPNNKSFKIAIIFFR